MKKNKLNMVVAIALCVSLGLSSCIGSFKLTNKVLGWNEGVGNKFVNELVFIAFHIIPVYELTVVADILVLNSIEFWSGENLVSQSTKEVKGENGDTYLVTTDENGYTITNQKDNTTIGFVFDSNDNSWSVSANGETTKFMTFVDDNPGQPCANLFGSRRLPSFPCTEQTLLNRILRVVARMQNAEAESIKPLHIFLCDAGKRIGFHTPLPLSFCCLKNPSPYIRSRSGKSLIEKGHTAKKHDVPF